MIPNRLSRQWQQRSERWLNKRIPPARQFSLDMRSVFIFPSKFGVMYIALCTILFVLGTNYQNNLIILLCYFLVAVFILNLFIAYLNFALIAVHLGKTHDIYAGDELKLALWFNAKKQAKQHPKGTVYMQFWEQKTATEFDLDSGQNPAYVSVTVRKRGYLKLPRLTLKSVYPLGIFKCWTHLAFNPEIMVYPKPINCPIALINNVTAQHSDHSPSTLSGSDDFDSLKDYTQGESLSHVAWKQLAKGQGMYSKQFSTDISTAGWLTLLPCSSDELETRLGQLTFQVIELTRQHRSFGLDLGHLKIEPDSGINHQGQCLKALALFQWGANND